MRRYQATSQRSETIQVGNAVKGRKAPIFSFLKNIYLIYYSYLSSKKQFCLVESLIVALNYPKNNFKYLKNNLKRLFIFKNNKQKKEIWKCLVNEFEKILNFSIHTIQYHRIYKTKAVSLVNWLCKISRIRQFHINQ